MATKEPSAIVLREETLHRLIFKLRGQQVILDRDMATLYQVETRALKQAVKRNAKRFPADFMWVLDEREVDELVSQSVIPGKGALGGALPFAFAEQGVAALSSVLTSDRAIEVNIAIMRAFVALRRMLANHAVLLQRMDTLEQALIRHLPRQDPHRGRVRTAQHEPPARHRHLHRYAAASGRLPARLAQPRADRRATASLGCRARGGRMSERQTTADLRIAIHQMTLLAVGAPFTAPNTDAPVRAQFIALNKASNESGRDKSRPYGDILGFCKSATLDEIRKHGHVLTLGRYVGAETAEDDGEAFADKMQRLSSQWREQQQEAARLDAAIAASLKELGYGW
ncbi:MAG: ORF6N domain-containing protein [Pseudomonadales bacterium]|nr:ORF6N domain-containing protein [Pseudomonadales bacterium]